ncbi:uncharacterized protein LOC108679317 [Hyalella azteca]|uniref:Uncharacterized protein LOC108679317 n=1 Tax=Hyalella azteca TaxID=294128 RepID=A0A8B7PB64_HYAAZ|nr:uncharacterized protein LOC108679317 [Hyalella azteca]
MAVYNVLSIVSLVSIASLTQADVGSLGYSDNAIRAGQSGPAVSFVGASSQSSQTLQQGSFTPDFLSGVAKPNPATFGSTSGGNRVAENRLTFPESGDGQFVNQQFVVGGASSSDGRRSAQATSGQSGQAGVFTSGSGNIVIGSGLSPANAPQYEEHAIPRTGPVQLTNTVTNFVTKTHTLRVPSTSDVWVTSVTMVKIPVTQLATQRTFVRAAPDTVTSLVRITSTPVSVLTQTVDVFPTKTVVSIFTSFVTETQTVELWQPIEHVSTSYEVITRPVLETQSLLQRLFTTVTTTRTINVTSLRSDQLVPRSGPVSTSFGGYY